MARSPLIEGLYDAGKVTRAALEQTGSGLTGAAALAQEALERAAQKIGIKADGKATKLRRISDDLNVAADQTRASLSEGAKQDQRDFLDPTADFTRGEFRLGARPTLRGGAMVALDAGAQAASQILPTVAATRLGGPRAGAFVGSALGAAAAGGAAGRDERERIEGMAPADLQQIEAYRAGIADGLTEAQAREQVAGSAEVGGALGAGLAGAAGGYATSKIFGQAGQRVIGKVAGNSLPARIAGTAAVSAGEEGVQEVAEGVGQRFGGSEAIGEEGRQITEGSTGNFVGGALGGASAGAGIAALAPAPPATVQPERGPISRAAAKAVESGMAPGVVAPLTPVAAPRAPGQLSGDGVATPNAPPSPAITPPAARWQIGEADIVRNPTLPPAQKMVEARALEQVITNPDKQVADYRKLPGTDGGRIISVDEARDLFPDYSASADARSVNAIAVQEPASLVTKRVLAEELVKPPSGPDAFVLFTGGGTGSGKTSGLKSVPELRERMDSADVVYDANLQDASLARAQIERTLASGRKAEVVYTIADPVVAWRDGTLVRASSEDNGRAIPSDVHAATHIGAAKAALELAAEYDGSPDVKVSLLYNSFDPSGASVRPAAIEEVQAIASMDVGALTQELNNVLEQANEAGAIPQRALEGSRQVQVPVQVAEAPGQVSGPVGRAALAGGPQAVQAAAAAAASGAGAGQGGRPSAPAGNAGPEVGQGPGRGRAGNAGAVGEERAGQAGLGARQVGATGRAVEPGAGAAQVRSPATPAGAGTAAGAIQRPLGAPAVSAQDAGVPDPAGGLQRTGGGRGDEGGAASARGEVAVRNAGLDLMSADGIAEYNRTRNDGGSPNPEITLPDWDEDSSGMLSRPAYTSDGDLRWLRYADWEGRGRGLLVEDADGREVSFHPDDEVDARPQFLGAADVTKLPRDRDRFAASGLPRSRGGGQSVEAITLDRAFDLAKSRKFARGRDLKLALQEASLAAQRAARIDLTQINQRTLDVLSNAVSADARYALQSSSSAVGWYDRKVSQAMEILSLIHPELRTDQKSRLAFKWALAVTSNGMKVDKNFELAESAYGAWKKTGEMPTSIGIGNAASAINEGMRLFNHLSTRMASKQLESFMSTEFTVGEIAKAIGVKPGGEWFDTPVRGAAVLGPKIGNGFFSNLTGRFDSLTMDRWLMRTWGRLTGTLIDVDPKVVADSRRQLAVAVTRLAPAERAKLISLVGGDGKVNTNEATDALALAVNKASQKQEKRAEMQSSPRLDAVRKAGNSLTMKLDGSKEAPAGPGERMWIRTVFGRALDTMRAETGDMTMADLQALVWYPEKRLYDQAKAKDEVDEYNDDDAPDYANAAAALARANGIAPAAIKRALQAGESNRVPLSPEMDATAKAAFLRRTKAPPEQQAAIVFEAAPNPDNAEALAQWASLSEKQKRELTSDLGKSIFEDVKRLLRLNVSKTPVGALGGFEGDINPNLIAEFAKDKVSVDQSIAFSSAIGYVLDQKAMVLADDRVADQVEVIRITIDGTIGKRAKDIFDAIRRAEPSIDGFTARGSTMDVINFSGKDTLSVIDAIADALGEVDGITGGVSHATLKSKYITKEEYGGHIQKIGKGPADRERLGAGLDKLRDKARLAFREFVSRSSGGQDGAGAARRAAEPRSGKAAGKQAQEVDRSGLNRIDDQTKTPAFKRWFGDSKVVDAGGKPLVVYHGTTMDFSSFRQESHFGTPYAANKRLRMRGGTDRDGANIFPVYLSISNPKRIPDVGKYDKRRWDWAVDTAKLEGYDGIVYKNEVEGDADSYIAFHPNQVKSATGNSGAFDPANPSIIARRDQFAAPAAIRTSRTSAAMDSDEKAETQKALRVMQRMGYPKSWIDRIPSIFTHNQTETFSARFYLYGDLKGSVSVRTDQFGDPDRMVRNLSHELAHAADYNQVTEGFYSESSPLFAISERNGQMSFDGEVIAELNKAWMDDTPLAKELAYPFLNEYDMDAKTVKVEAFAQSFMLYFTDRAALKKHAPKTYKMIEEIIANEKQASASDKGGRSGLQEGSVALQRALRVTGAREFNSRSVAGGDRARDPAQPERRQDPPEADRGEQRPGDGPWEFPGSLGAGSDRLAQTFYSALTRSIEKAQGAPKRAPAAAWKQWLDGAVRRGEFKQSERDWVGIDAWLESQQGAITRDQLADFVRANEVQVRDVVLGDAKDAGIDFDTMTREQLDDLYEDQVGYRPGEDDPDMSLADLRELVRDAVAQPEARVAGVAKFAGYKVPGGQNYREMLLTLPVQDPLTKDERAKLDEAEAKGGGAQNANDIRLIRAKLVGAGYTSNHWDQPNVLAHVRFDERLDEYGKRVLFLHEVQSDWHQAGRKRGYKGAPHPLLAEAEKAFDAAQARGEGGADWLKRNPRYAAALQAWMTPDESRVTNAPLKQTDEWAMLAFKRMARWAVDNDFDRIAWVTGEQAAEMFDLSKQVNSIGYTPNGDGTFKLYVNGLNNETLIDEKNIDLDRIEALVGKEVALKIKRGEGRPMQGGGPDTGFRSLSGLDLKVGGAGMRGFYDKILPAAVNKWGKRLGVKAGSATMPGANKYEADDLYRQGFDEEYVEKRLGPEDDYKVSAIDITPAMRDAVLSGQAMFRRDQSFLGRAAPAPAQAFDGFTLPSTNLTDYLRDESMGRVERYKAAAAAGSEKLRVALQDYFLPVRRVQEAIERSGGAIAEKQDVYGREELYYGRTGEQLRQLEEEHVKPLVQAMVSSKVTQADLELFLYARFAPDRNARIAAINPELPDGGSGMSNADAARVLADFDAAGMTPRLDRLAKRVRDLNDMRINVLESAGLLSKDEADLWRAEPNYVPLKGVAGAAEGQVATLPRTGSGFSIGGREAHRALGRRSLATDLLANTVAQVQQAIIRAEKNRVAQALYRLARANPNEALWEIDATRGKASLDRKTGEVVYKQVDEPNAVMVKVDGIEHRIVIRDPRLLEAMKNMGAAKTGAFLRGFAKVNRFLSLTRTMLAPEFVLANFARDIQTASVNLTGEQSAGMAARVVKDVPQALRAMWRKSRGTSGGGEWARYANEFVEDGGLTSFVNQQTVEQQQEQIQGLLDEAKGGAKVAIKKLVRGMFDFVEDVNGAVENATRLSAYAEARRRGMSRQQAARLGKNLTVNFNRKGQVGPVMNSLYLFYNASIQGTQRFLRAMRSPAARKIMAATAMIGYGLAQWNRAAGGEDDDGEDKWDKIPEWEKARNLVILRPDGSTWKIPLPYSYNLPFLIGQQMEGMINGRTKPIAGALTIVESILTSFNPIGDIDLKGDSSVAAAKLAAPTAIDPFIDIAVNRNFFGSPINPERSPFDKVKEPDSQLVFPGTNPGVAFIAQALNRATGGDQLRPGLIDVGPESMTYIFNYLTGGTGAFVERTATAATLAMQGKDVPANRVPFYRVFRGELSDRRATDTFYRVRDDVNLWKEMADGGYVDPEDMRNVAIGKRLAGPLRVTERQLRLLRDRRKAAIAAGNEAQAEMLKAREIALQANFNRRYFEMVDR